MNSPVISIIVPTYNRAYIIEDTLNGILCQTFKSWECIVVDDGSDDETEYLMNTYIQKDTRFIYYKRPLQKPKGPNSCRNYGYLKSKGKYIMWFDSDDLLHPDALKLILNAPERDRDAIVAKTESVYMPTGKQVKINEIYSNNLIEDYFTGKISFYIGGVVWKRTFLESQPMLFDEYIGNLDDWDFNLRMLYNSPNILFLDKVLFTYRLHKKSFSTETRKFNKQQILSEFYARDKHLKLVKDRKDVNLKEVIQPYILKSYKRYLKYSIQEKNSLSGFLFRRFILKQIKFNSYDNILWTLKQMVKYYFEKLNLFNHSNY